MEWPIFVTQLSVSQLAVLVLTTVVTLDAIRRFVRKRIERKGYPSPPGPTPLPLLGNVLSINPTESWLTYTSWSAKYGDIIYARVFDSDIVVLNSFSAAKELLEKRSHIYSDRPHIATVEPYGHDFNLGFTRYGPQWRLCRRIVHQTFRAEAALTFRPMQLRRARQIVTNMIDDPDEYPFYYATFAAATAMSVVYDYEPQPRADPMVTIADDFIKKALPAIASEKALLVKLFPFLLSVPKWIPALSWISREAKEAFALRTQMVETPYQWVQKRVVAKKHVESDAMVVDHIRRMEKMDGSERVEYEKALKFSAAISFLASTDTTGAALMSFTLAMVKNPQVWKRAQADIDVVVGTDRLPEFEDRSSLPYIDAIMRETFRWRPVAPIGVPHATLSSDIYNGYYIPRGATVIANAWAMSRDETRYPNPEVFSPERFLDSDGMLTDDDPAHFAFGFGRRICPGRYTADASVWGAIATMLATLDFNTRKDANGDDIEFEAEFTNGLSHHPVFFPCNLTLRAHMSREFLQHSLTK